MKVYIVTGINEIDDYRNWWLVSWNVKVFSSKESAEKFRDLCNDVSSWLIKRLYQEFGEAYHEARIEMELDHIPDWWYSEHDPEIKSIKPFITSTIEYKVTEMELSD